MTISKEIRHSLIYGLALALLLLVLKWLDWQFLIIDHSLALYLGVIAIFFTGIGIWMAFQMRPKVKEAIVEKEATISENQNVNKNKVLNHLNLTERESEILELIIAGHSNAEIANALFLSVSTVKSHISNLYAKMDVKRRTQAIAKAKQLHISV